MRQINDLGIHGLLRHTGLALLVATVLVSAALADQTPPPPIKPAAINTTADWDVGTCKARGGVVGRTHAGRAICLKAKMTPDKYKEQQGPQAAQPQPAQAAPNVGRTVGPRNPTYETPAPPPTQPETPPQTPAPDAGAGSGGLLSSPWFWGAVAGAGALTVAAVAVAAGSSSAYNSSSSSSSGYACPTDRTSAGCFSGGGASSVNICIPPGCSCSSAGVTYDSSYAYACVNGGVPCHC